MALFLQKARQGRAWCAAQTEAMKNHITQHQTLATLATLTLFARLASGQFAEVAPGLAQPPFPCVAVGDYDKDGNVDVLVAGMGKRDVPFTTLYRNTGGAFVDSGIVLPGLSRATAAWGDFDGDGDLDLAMTGLNAQGVPVTRICRNDGGTFTLLTNLNLAPVFAGNVAWGDYDGDGRLDLLVTGITSASASGVAVTRLYHNDGNGGFTSVPHPFPDCYLGAASWGDYDNDGHLDLILSGATTGGGLVCGIWHNDGNGGFTNINAGLPGMDLGYAVWGDYDNDGELDLLFGGNTDAGWIARLYHNDNGTFTDTEAGLLPVLWASAAWGDYDNDGKLDIMVMGYDPVAQVARSSLYHNNGGSFSDSGATFHNLYLGALSWFDYDDDGRLDVIMAGNDVGADILRLAHNTGATTNSIPAAPTNLTASINGTGVDLTWGAGSDLQTPVAGLSYNLRVGMTPGGAEVVSPQSAANGRRLLPAMGNMQLDRAAHLNGLKPGTTYYWSVQTVDTAFAGSLFATEGTFTIPPAAPLNISFIREATGTVHTTWRGSPGTSYRVDVSGDLQHWTTLTHLTAASGTGLFELVETPAPEIQQRYYRAAFP
jgi:hypothetical protein